jgi:Hemerythrin HHE cation binding domain.
MDDPQRLTMMSSNCLSSSSCTSTMNRCCLEEEDTSCCSSNHYSTAGGPDSIVPSTNGNGPTSSSSSSSSRLTSSTATTQEEDTSNVHTPTTSSSPKRLFAECALVEIIHLHDCLRGAMRQIQQDVDSLVLTASVIDDDPESLKEEDCSHGLKDQTVQVTRLIFDIEKANDLSNNVASRFHLIWSVFQAHSGAEDEFIWPALKMKIESKKRSGNGATCPTSPQRQSSAIPVHCGCESHLEQESYEEDHEMEETMFKQINTNLRRLNGSFRYYHANPHPAALCIIKKVVSLLKEQTDQLTKHLEEHLEKEETHCLPMVKKHMTNDEISTLVGQIMGKRSAEMMGKILNLAVCSLPTDEREDMVQCLKRAMGGTFFEKWLTMGGWDSTSMIDKQTQKKKRKRTRMIQSKMGNFDLIVMVRVLVKENCLVRKENAVELWTSLPTKATSE